MHNPWTKLYEAFLRDPSLSSIRNRQSMKHQVPVAMNSKSSISLTRFFFVYPSSSCVHVLATHLLISRPVKVPPTFISESCRSCLVLVYPEIPLAIWLDDAKVFTIECAKVCESKKGANKPPPPFRGAWDDCSERHKNKAMF